MSIASGQDIRVKFVIQRKDRRYEDKALCIFCPQKYTLNQAFHESFLQDGVADAWRALGLWRSGEKLKMEGILFDDETNPTHTNYNVALSSTYRTSSSRILVKATTQEDIIDIATSDEEANDNIDGIPITEGLHAASSASALKVKCSIKKKKKSTRKIMTYKEAADKASKRSKQLKKDKQRFGQRTHNKNLPKEMKPGSLKQDKEHHRRLYCCHEGDTPTTVVSTLNLFENDGDPIGRLIYDNRSNHHGLKPNTKMKGGSIFVIPSQSTSQDV